MLETLSIIYGIHLTLLTYLSAILTAKGLGRLSIFSIGFILAKYFIYWKVIEFGFSYLPIWGILTGFIVSIYGSLPILYFYNRSAARRHA